MAGIYVHIPFCRRACHYCDFHFTTNLRNTAQLVDAILKEIVLRKDYLQGEKVETIYFGGGTPSLLRTTEIERILNTLQKHQSVDSNLELTLEANPEDLNLEKLKELKSVGINRLSLGTQSFIDTELKWMNRMHTAKQAIQSISTAQSVGFDNISIDLIFGLRDQTEQDWKRNLNQAVALNVQHISSYSLTIEPKTALSHSIQKGEQKLPDENSAASFFEMNMDFLPANGFEHYEVSNFAKSGFISKHNSSYWQQKKYLGLGPSAHSFNGSERSWNVRSNGGYIQKINSSSPFSELEKLSEIDKVNEHIMIGLRTKWGIQKEVLDQIGKQYWVELMKRTSLVNEEELVVQTDTISLSRTGMLQADRICALLFAEE